MLLVLLLLVLAVVSVVYMPTVVVDVTLTGAFAVIVSDGLVMIVHQPKHGVTHLLTVGAGHSWVVLQQGLDLHVDHVHECVLVLVLVLVWVLVVMVLLGQGHRQANKGDNNDFHGGAKRLF